MNKVWYKSKTVWVNLIAVVGIVFFGKEVDPQISVAVLAVINFLLRLITKEEIVFSNGN